MSTQTKCGRCGALYVKGDTTATVCPQCAFAAAVTAPHEVEAEAEELLARLPGLSAVAKLGRGGMGVVYRARQTRLGRDVAVKVISSQFAADPEFQRRFTQEAQILASLDHPNIVAVHDCGIQGDLEYFVMEYVEGESVRALLDRKAVQDPLRVVLDVAEALAYAHEKGVIHRDIKPENVLIRRDGRVKVVDFGIARLGIGTSRLTKSDLVIGTPAYMAPEQRENPAAVDHRVDVYAIGLLAREMLTGKGPQDGMPSVTGVDEAAAQVILRALEREPSRRYQTMREMASAVRALVAPEEQGHRPPPLPLRERVARLRASRLFWVMMTGAAFLVALFAVRLDEGLASDPKALFDQLLTERIFGPEPEPLAAMKDARISEQVGALLASEAASNDEKRRWTAFVAALDLGRLDRIPPDVRARAVLHHPGQGGASGWSRTLFDDELLPFSLDAIREGGPALAAEVYSDLLQGGIPPERQDGAVYGIAAAADAALVTRMRDFLVAKPDDPMASAVLLAFAGSVDLPLPGSELGLLEKPVPRAVLDTYVKHLPGLLDGSTAEADWDHALPLVEDLGRLQEMCNQSDRWMEEHGGAWKFGRGHGFDPGGSPIEVVARGLGLSSPPDVQALEEQIRSSKGCENAYAKALIVRWKKQGRATLPYSALPEPEGPLFWLDQTRSPSGSPSTFSARGGAPGGRYGLEQARAILDSIGDVPRWEATAILFPSLAAAPQVIGVTSGKGRVRARLSAEAAVSVPGEALRVGLRPGDATAAHARQVKVGVDMEGTLERVKGSEYRYEGTARYSMWSVSGTQKRAGPCQAGEAFVMQLEPVQLERIPHGLGYLFLVVPEPASHGDPSQRWKEAIAASLRGTMERKGLDSGALEDPLVIAAWTPVPEATEALRGLWSQRAVLARSVQRSWTEHFYIRKARIDDLVGAALLMAGDAEPLAEPGLLQRLPPLMLLRIRLFSRSETIRRAAVGGEKAIVTPEDAADFEEGLREMHEEDPAIERRASEVRPTVWGFIANNRLQPALVLVGIGLLLGWLVPRRPLRGRALAAALAFTGLLMRLVTIEADGRVWFPVGGDLLLVVAAFLYGGRGLRLLSLALAVAGVLGFMLPSSPMAAAASGGLLCLYVAALSLDALSRRLPGRIRWQDALAHCATWWALVVPVGFAFAAMLGMGLVGRTAAITLFTLHGNWEGWYIAAMLVGPLWLARANRLAR